VEYLVSRTLILTNDKMAELGEPTQRVTEGPDDDKGNAISVENVTPIKGLTF
jgi:hypothetical protein